MSNHEINGLDLDDIGLQQVMGNRFHDATRQPTAESFGTESTNTTQPKKMAQKPMDKAVDAQWEPARPEPNFMEKLQGCAKYAVLFGGLTFLIFCWNEAGLMASSIAVPSMCVCTALGGWGVGKSCTRGNR